MDNQSGKIQRAIICLLLLVGGATGLKDVKIKVPDMVRSGDDALLSCNYDLESASLYAIKWYRGDVEFYRYLPKEAPSHTAFPVQGMKIDISKSDNHDVTLVNVSRELTGRYRCEVSADAPSFHTVIKEAPMEVVDVPETNPTIVAERQRLPAGETLRANCTSGPSRPAPVIKWTLNGNLLNNDTMQYKVQSQRLAQYEMETTRSSLELKISSDLFQDGRLQVRCFAEISNVYRDSVELDVTEDAPLLAPITGDASPHSHHSSGCGHQVLSETQRLIAVVTTMVNVVNILRVSILR